MSVVAAHWVDVTGLHRARAAPAGSVVVVDLGDRRDVTLNESWRIRALVIDAELVTLVGGTGPARDRLCEFLDAHPDAEVPA